MKIVFESEEQIVAISKYGKHTRIKDKKLQSEYLRFKMIFRNDFNMFHIKKDTYNKYSFKSWIFEASLKENSFSPEIK